MRARIGVSLPRCRHGSTFTCGSKAADRPSVLARFVEKDLDTDEGDRRFDAFMQTFIAQRRGPGDRDALTARGYTDGQGCGSSDRRGYGDEDGSWSRGKLLPGG